jgi:arginyl-tRNA synthetase
LFLLRGILHPLAWVLKGAPISRQSRRKGSVTMDMFADFKARVVTALSATHPDAGLEEALLSRISVELPRDPSHGDLSTNAAMVLAKPLKMNPRAVADALAEWFASDPDVNIVEVAGPGFLNFRLEPTYWQKLLGAVLAAGDSWGRSTVGAGQAVNVEYVSANPTGPMHVGHCRGAVVGDAIANLLATTGHNVTREYYMNDAGVQVDVLARSAHLRYRQACGEDTGPIPEGLYPGDYLIPVGAVLKARFGDSLLGQDEADWLPQIRPVTIDAMMALIRADLKALGIQHEVFFSERSLIEGEDRVAAAIDDLRSRDLIYEGHLSPPKGQLPEDWEDREQTLFRSTAFGDDVDRPLIKSDGSYTYFASDIAYHRDKYLRGFNRMIDIWGADHGGYVKRMTSAVKAISAEEAQLDVRLCQLVKLYRDGEPVRMSKRAGDFVTLRDVVDEVGSDAVRFMMLTARAMRRWILILPKLSSNHATTRCSMFSTPMPVFSRCFGRLRRLTLASQAALKRSQPRTLRASTIQRICLDRAHRPISKSCGKRGCFGRAAPGRILPSGYCRDFPFIVEQGQRHATITVYSRKQ